jgi:hypothetical protein
MGRFLTVGIVLVFGLGATSGLPASNSAPIQKKEAVKNDRVAIKVGGSTLHLRVKPGPSPISDEATRIWVRRSAGMLTHYFGRFSVPSLKVHIITGGGGSLGWGQHFGGKLVEIHAGKLCTVADVEKDWVMVHEMLHTAFPNLARKHRWMREGLSTYLESVVRVRAGVIPPESMWERWVNRMHHGLPQPGDQGYDQTRSWGTLYWGGALFWFLADVQIREETQGKKNLRHALRAILDAGGNSLKTWSTEKAIGIGDKATGTRVLASLYADMAKKPGSVDLEKLWRDLGIVVNERGDVIGYDSDARLAWIRKALSKREHALPPLPQH